MAAFITRPRCAKCYEGSLLLVQPEGGLGTARADAEDSHVQQAAKGNGHVGWVSLLTSIIFSPSPTSHVTKCETRR